MYTFKEIWRNLKQIVDQDEHLNVLVESLEKQQRIGNLISNELESQIGLLQGIENEADVTQVGIKRTMNDYLNMMHEYQESMSNFIQFKFNMNDDSILDCHFNSLFNFNFAINNWKIK